MLKGTQTWNSYGQRTNRYLLLNYGFALENNLDDSFQFQVSFDRSFSTKIYPDLMKMLDVNENTESATVQNIRLKRNQLNEMLMNYIRYCFKKGFRLDMKKRNEKKMLLLSRVVHLDFEKKCLKRYEEIIKHLNDELNKNTTLE